MLDRIKAYFAPNRRMARKLKKLQRYAGLHGYMVAHNEFGRWAQQLEETTP